MFIVKPYQKEHEQKTFNSEVEAIKYRKELLTKNIYSVHMEYKLKEVINMRWDNVVDTLDEIREAVDDTALLEYILYNCLSTDQASEILEEIMNEFYLIDINQEV